MKYTVIIEKAGENYAAYAPDLSGCGTTGPTRDEVIRLMQEAIAFHLEGLRRRDGEPVPPPQTTAAQVHVAA